MASPIYPVSLLDFEQIIQHVYDETTQTLRTNATATITGDVQVEIDAADGDNIALADASGTKVTVTTIGPDVGLDVNIIGGIVDVTGTITPTGVDNGVKATRIAVNDTTPVEVTAGLTGGRDSASVRVLSTVPVYFGGSTVTNESGIDPGYPKYYREEIIMDIQRTVTTRLYAICDTGESAVLALLEI